MNTLVFGMQYGDEGKGKVVHHLVTHETFEGCVRYSGGCNAGHTVVKDGTTYKLHHLPCGIVEGLPCYLEPGMVIDLEKLQKEATGFDPELIHIHKNTHLITSSHKEEDANHKLGTTGSGNGPCYRDKAMRIGHRIRDLDSITPFQSYENKIFYNGSYLFEGNQGFFLDVDCGHYPFVTSSSIFPSCRYGIKRIVGVMKAYTTRVGEGPPYREDLPLLREIGHEYGTTTGRPRKCYLLDLDEIKTVLNTVPIDEIAITKCDVLVHTTMKAFIYKNERHDFCTISEYLGAIRRIIPRVKYLSWSPGPEIEVLPC